MISWNLSGISRIIQPYIIPKPFDSRLMDYVPTAVAQAAVDSGVATRDYSSSYVISPIK